MNLAKGYLECKKQDYKPLKKLLVSRTGDLEGHSDELFQKTIPLNTPTDIELKPGVSLRVTLLDVGSMASLNAKSPDNSRQIIVLEQSCSLLKMTPKQYSTRVTYDVSLT